VDISSVSWAYLAAIVDGEGTPEFQFNKRYKSHLNVRAFPRLTVVNTSYPLIKWLKTTFGGYVQVHKRKTVKRNYAGSCSQDWKKCYEWRLGRRDDLKRVLEGILPFCIVKRERVMKALRIINILEKMPRVIYRDANTLPLRLKALRMATNGKSISEIAKTLKLDWQNVRYWVKGSPNKLEEVELFMHCVDELKTIPIP